MKAATGWDIDADPIEANVSPEARALVDRLNLDRACGALTGDIDQSYIDKLIAENFAPQQGQSNRSAVRAVQRHGLFLAQSDQSIVVRFKP